MTDPDIEICHEQDELRTARDRHPERRVVDLPGVTAAEREAVRRRHPNIPQDQLPDHEEDA